MLATTEHAHGSRLTHDYTANDIRSKASCESPESFFSTDAENGIESVVVPEPLCRRFCTVGTHSHKSHLRLMSGRGRQLDKQFDTHLCWIPDQAGQTTSDACTQDFHATRKS
jgi:hypothetical protein